MELLNATKYVAGYTQGLRPDARELLVVAVKGTFTIPKNGEQLLIAEEKVPLIEADVFTGEPGFSAPVYETDYAPVKPKCDVILNGSAYAPGGRPALRVPVSLQAGPISKSFYVVGHRVWQKNITGFRATQPQAFTVMPISYDNAFGGVDDTHEKSEKHRAYFPNPIGLGFHTK